MRRRSGMISRSREIAIPSCTVRGGIIWAGSLSSVTANGSPSAAPRSGSNRRAHTLKKPLRLDRKYTIRPSGDHRGRSSKNSPVVILTRSPPADRHRVERGSPGPVGAGEHHPPLIGGKPRLPQIALRRPVARTRRSGPLVRVGWQQDQLVRGGRARRGRRQNPGAVRRPVEQPLQLLRRVAAPAPGHRMRAP